MSQMIFLSSSVPPADLKTPSVHKEVARAVAVFAYSIFSSGGRIVFGGHPSVTPFVLESAETMLKITPQPRQPLIKMYQSEIFIRNIVSSATRELFVRNIAELVLTPLVEGEILFTANQSGPIKEGKGSLELMRRRMIQDNDLSAAIFIGGSDGVRTELEHFKNFFPDRPVYFIGATAGASRQLATEHRQSEDFLCSSDYMQLAQAALEELKKRSD